MQLQELLVERFYHNRSKKKDISTYFLMKQTKSNPLHKFVQGFGEAISEVHIRNESATVQDFKIALTAEEKACFKYLIKCEIPTTSKLYYYYCEKFRNKQEELKIREYRLGLDNNK